MQQTREVASTYHVLTGIWPLTTLAVRIAAYNDKGWSEYGTEANVSTTEAIVPFAPEHLRTSDLPKGYFPTTAISIRWESSSYWHNTGADVVVCGREVQTIRLWAIACR